MPVFMVMEITWNLEGDNIRRWLSTNLLLDYEFKIDSYIKGAVNDPDVFATKF